LRYFGPGQLQFITSSTYQRVKLFESERFRRDFVNVLRPLREPLSFLLIGWGLMPEHFHFLLQPQPAESTSRILQELKKQTALRVISTLGANRQYPCDQNMQDVDEILIRVVTGELTISLKKVPRSIEGSRDYASTPWQEDPPPSKARVQWTREVRWSHNGDLTSGSEERHPTPCARMWDASGAWPLRGGFS
jgi:REP element-mobilizing transposase RayT